jgi:iron complex outermembrane receptor protein
MIAVAKFNALPAVLVRAAKYSLAFFMLLLLFAPAGVSAQEKGDIEGKIFDARTKEPLPGANVSLQGTTLGSATDVNGFYQITGVTPGEYILVAQFISKATQRRKVTVTAGEKTARDFSLAEQALSLESVVITATRYEKDLKDVPASISLVGAQDIERRAATYQGDELIGVSSVRARRNDEGEFVDIAIRGVPNRQINDTFIALVDGVPMVTGSDQVELDRLVPPSVVQRVEVVKGPMSALYGRGGISGAVNYITKNTFGVPRLVVGVNPGTYGYVRPFVEAAIPLQENKNRLFVSAFYERKNGWRDGTDRDMTSVFVKDQWLINPNFTASFYVNYQDIERGVGSPIPLRPDRSLVAVAGGREANYEIDNAGSTRTLWLSTLQLENRFSANLSLRTTLNYRRHESNALVGFYTGFNEAASVIHWNGFNGIGKSRILFVEPQLTWQLGRRARLITGASYERADGHEDEFFTGEYGFNPQTFEFLFYIQKRNYRTGEFTNRDKWITDHLLDAEYGANISAAYAQTEIDLSEQAALTLGARFDRFERKVDFGVTTVEGVPQAGASSSDRANHLSPKIALNYKLSPSLTAYASFSEGFSPAFGPVWSFRGRRTDLNPEVARNVESGLKGVLANGRLAFYATAYQVNRRDLLVLRYQTSGISIPENAGAQRSRGIEFELQGDIPGALAGLSGFASYTYTRSEWTDYKFNLEFSNEVVDLSGKKVAGVSEHMYSAGVNQRLTADFTASLWWDGFGDYFADSRNLMKGDAYGLANASVAYQFARGRGLEVRVTATNLFDKEYYSFAAYSGPVMAYPGRPREVFATVRYALK